MSRPCAKLDVMSLSTKTLNMDSPMMQRVLRTFLSKLLMLFPARVRGSKANYSSNN